MMDKRTQFSSLPLAARTQALLDYVRTAAGNVAGIPAERIDLNNAISDPQKCRRLFFPIVLADLGLPLYPSDFSYCTSLRRLAEFLAIELESDPPAGPSVADFYQGGQWAWGSAGPPIGPRLSRRAAFILSAPRSGSTLLRVMLAGHPGIFAPPELHLLPFRSMRQRRELFEALGYSWMRRGLLTALVELEQLTPRRAEARLAAMEENDTAVTDVYRQIQASAGARMLIDKTPVYAFHPSWLQCAEDTFAGARYIFLVRHPASAIESFVRMRFHRLLGRHWLVWDQNAWLYAEKCWTAANQHISAFLDRVDPARHIRISYEDLVTRPTHTATRICEFLEIPFDPAVVSPYSSARSTIDYRGWGPAIGDVNFLLHSAIDSSLAMQSARTKLPQRIAEQTRRVAESFGYQIDSQ